MILIILPVIILCVFSFVEFLFPYQERLRIQVYRLAFFISYFIVAIKYCYGPDIALYIPLFENVETPNFILKNGTQFKDFEIGYVMLCSIAKYIGCSYWFFSFLITTLYFYTIAKLLKRIEKYKTFALFLIVLFDCNMLFFQFRETVAVSFFILSFLAYSDKKYFKYIILTILAIFTHKSAVFACLLTFFAFNINQLRATKRNYIVILICLLLFAFISIKDVILGIISYLPLDETTVKSIEFHIQVERRQQTIFFVYFFAIYCLYYYGLSQKKDSFSVPVLIFFLIVVLFYQNWYLLSRFRSYFMPIVIVYVIKELDNQINKNKLYKQLLVVTLYAFCFFFCRGIIKSYQKSESKILKSTTIFSLTEKTEEEIKEASMQKASVFWKYDNSNLVVDEKKEEK